MMEIKNKKDAAKRVSGGKGGCSVLLRRFGALMLAVCLLAAIPMDAAAAGEGTPAPTEATSAPEPETLPLSENDDELVFVSTLPKDRTDLYNFLDSVTIKDEDGNEVPVEDGTLYVGEKYKIHLEFKEGGPLGLQFATDGQITYQIPKSFHVEPIEDMELKVTIDGAEITVGHYSIDENGKLTLTLTEDGKTALNGSYDVALKFDMEAEARATEESGDGTVDFGDTGEKFKWKVVDQPRVSVEKEGRYEENADNKGGTVHYTVKTTVDRGEFHDAEVTDVLTPPQTPALQLEMRKTGDQPDVTVTVTKKDGTVVTLSAEDYDLVPAEENPDPANPYKQSFRVKLKGKNATLYEGDVLSVTYNYDVQYVEGSTEQFWGNVLNTATVTGEAQLPNPEEPDKTVKVPVDEKRESNVEILATPPGHGIVCKDQSYDEATHTLHYTLYTVVPAGQWTPLYIYDDMVVEYEGKRWYLQEFSESGRVKNLEVYATDVDNWFEGWDDKTTGEQKIQDLSALKAQAKADGPLTGYDFNKPLPKDTDYLTEYVYKYDRKDLGIIFGLKQGENDPAKGKWGHWGRYEKDRLIVTEYDLDMSDELGTEVVLSSMDEQGKTLTLTPKDVLLAGIKNNVYLYYGGYRAGYSVFFNNADKMNKTGELRKEGADVFIDYTVTMNTTDKTVNKYFRDVKDDWFAEKEAAGGWFISTMWENCMQAAFHDVLPDGWEYVSGSLAATARDVYGNEQYIPYNATRFSYPEKVDGKNELYAPLVYFFNEEGTGYNGSTANHELYNTFGEDLASLTFTYTLQATEDWLKEQAKKPDGTVVPVHNYAALKDKNMTHWSDDSTIPYIPDKLTKSAVQVDGGNLLQFTLQVNPGGKTLKSDAPGAVARDYLLVSDISENLVIQTDTIVVKNAESGQELKRINSEESAELGGRKDVYSLYLNEDGSFQLKVPNGVALTVTYDALVPDRGSVSVSNKASIQGVEGISSSFDDVLDVKDISGRGTGSMYELTIKKEDVTDNTKALAGAKFKFYIVIPDEATSQLESNCTVTVDGKEYTCYSEEGWTLITGEDGKAKIDKDKSWNLASGYYYILEETEAPAGYQKLEKPILFYYGAGNDEAYSIYPGAELVLPNSTLTVSDPPEKKLQVVKTDALSAPDKTDYLLDGAVFELRKDTKDGTVLYTGTSDGEGVVQWADAADASVGADLKLSEGTYFLAETAAPDGYNKLEDPIQIVVAADGSITLGPDTPADAGVVLTDGTPTVTITVPNPSSYKLPESGGAGTAWLYTLGTALLFTAAALLVCDARRRKTRG